ncbi:MAG: flagellar hook-basal body complex protein FliE [Pseudomonadales bacterium]|nr:flagellar hook-basal body complex protein FliE [Pseudomonadales bacterium]
MTIEAIGAIGQIDSLDKQESTNLAKSSSNFDNWLSSQISQVNENISAAETSVQKLAIGETDNLHQVMIAISRAQTSFDLMVQVRNRLVESSQELLRMSI